MIKAKFSLIVILFIFSSSLYAEKEGKKNLIEKATGAKVDPPPGVELSVSFYPKLIATSSTHTTAFEEDRYDPDIETLGLGLSFYVIPKEDWHGMFGGVGLDFYPNRDINIVRNDGAQEVSVAGSNMHFIVGYRIWRFYAGAGLQYAFFNYGDSDKFEVSRSIGIRTMAGVDIFPWLKIESFYGFHRSVATVNEDYRTANEPDEYDLSYGAYGVYVRFVLNEIF